jgi:DNA topoisomerase VI subunit B
MGCGCSKNKPKVNNFSPRNQTIASQNIQQLRANQTPRPNPTIVAAQSHPEAHVQSNQLVPVVQKQEISHPSTQNLSPAGMDAARRSIERMRRAAIREKLNR